MIRILISLSIFVYEKIQRFKEKLKSKHEPDVTFKKPQNI